MILPSVLAAKLVYHLSKITNFGAGGTWPGEIALRIDPKILSHLAKQLKYSVLIAGTNGKTTTAKMVEYVLTSVIPSTSTSLSVNSVEGSHSTAAVEKDPSTRPPGLVGMTKSKIVHNASGANLLNGIAAALIQKTDIFGKVNADIGVFEVDEASLPLALNEYTPSIVILLNLFRDQLDRYGEVDSIADKWLTALKKLGERRDKKVHVRNFVYDPVVILNADDPHLAFIGSQLKTNVLYFGIGDSKSFLKFIPHAVDTIYCPKCGKRLVFEGHYLSHLGNWKCPSCNLSHPKNDIHKKDVVSPLPGLYNVYNTMAATLTISQISKIRLNKIGIKKFCRHFRQRLGGKKNLKLMVKK